MSEKQTFESYGVQAEIREGEKNRYALWDLGEIVWPDGTSTRITSITNESKEEPGNFGSLAAAVYRLQHGKPMRGTVNAIARRAVKNFTRDGVELTVNAVVHGLTDSREITRSTKVAGDDRRNMQGAARDLFNQIVASVATNAYVHLNAAGWKRASQANTEDADGEESEALV
jgi:hypothetical protein